MRIRNTGLVDSGASDSRLEAAAGGIRAGGAEMHRFAAFWLFLLLVTTAPASGGLPPDAERWSGPEHCDAVDAVRGADASGWQPLAAQTPPQPGQAWLRFPLPPAWPPQMLVLPTTAALQLSVYLPGVEAPEQRDVYMPAPPHTGSGYWHNVLMLAPKQGAVLICLQGRMTQPAAVQLVDANQQIEHELDLRTLLAGSIAIILAMSAFALTFWLTLRDRVFLLYFGHALAFLLFAGLNDWALTRFLTDLPGAPRSILYLRGFTMALSAAATLAFARRFLDLPRGSPRIDRLLNWMVRALLLFGAMEVLSVAALGLGAVWVINIENLLVGVSCLALMIASVRLAWEGNRYARYFCIGWLPFLLVVLTSVSANMLGAEFAQEVRLLVLPAAAFEAFLLSIGLADRALALKRERDLAQRMAECDVLTGVLNRRGFEARLLAQASTRKSGALMLCDLDHFKHINDRFGHPVGDRCLQAFAERALRVLPTSAELGRYGGEEFVVLLYESDPAAVRAVAERLRLEVADTPVVVDSEVITLTVSIGLVGFDGTNSSSLATLLARADAALYRAKAEGRNCIVEAEPANLQA